MADNNETLDKTRHVVGSTIKTALKWAVGAALIVGLVSLPFSPLLALGGAVGIGGGWAGFIASSALVTKAAVVGGIFGAVDGLATTNSVVQENMELASRKAMVASKEQWVANNLAQMGFGMNMGGTGQKLAARGPVQTSVLSQKHLPQMQAEGQSLGS